MSTGYLDPVKTTELGPGWSGYAAHTSSFVEIQTGVNKFTRSASTPNTDEYIYWAPVDANTSTITFSLKGINAVTSASQVKVYVYGSSGAGHYYYYYGGGDLVLNTSVKKGSSWETDAQIMDATSTSAGWYSVTFTNSYSKEDIENMEVRLVAQDTSIGTTLYIQAIYVEVTYTSSAATAIDFLSYPIAGEKNVASDYFSVLTNGTHAGVVVTPSDSGAGGSFSPSTVTLSSSSDGTATVADTFNRADSTTSLGTTDTGLKTWTAHTGTWGISSNSAYTSALAGGFNVSTVDPGLEDFYIESTLTTAGTYPGLCIKYTDASNFILVIYEAPASRWRIEEIIKGAEYYTAFFYTASAPANGDTIGIRVVNDIIQVVHNGTVVGIGAIQRKLASTRVGMCFYNSAPNPQYNDFSCKPPKSLIGRFKYTPTTTGDKTISTSNGSSLTNPSGVNFFSGNANSLSVTNFSFETPTTADSTYNPSGATWSFTTGNAGIAKAGSINPPGSVVPSGLQFGILNLYGAEISQAISTTIGTYYKVAYVGSSRSSSPGNYVKMFFDSTLLKSGDVHFAEWEDRVSPYFKATGTSHTLKFGTYDGLPYSMSLIDNVRISYLSEDVGSPPVSSNGMFLIF